jgi:hypothetical protein
LTTAIGLAFDVRPAANATEAVEVTRDLLVNLQRIIPKEWLNAKTQANALITATHNKLHAIETLLRENIGSVDSTFTFVVSHLGGPPVRQIGIIAHDCSLILISRNTTIRPCLLLNRVITLL